MDSKKTKKVLKNDTSEVSEAGLFLVKEKKLTERIIQTIPSGIRVYDFIKGTTTFINKAYTSILGYNLSEIIGLEPEDYFALFHPDDKQAIIEHIENVENGKQDRIEYRFKHKKGNWVWCSSEDAPFELSEDGRVKSLVGIITDISKDKKQRKSLKKSETELKLTQKINHIGNWNLNIETDEIIWSDELYKLHDLDDSIPPPTQPEQKELFTAKSWALISDAILACSKKGTPYNLEVLTSKTNSVATWLMTKGEAVRNNKGEIIEIKGSTQDITLRKTTEMELKRSNQLLLTSQSIAQLGGWELNILTNDLYWTAETYAIHEISPSEFNPNVDASIGYYLPESRDILSKAIKAAIEEGKGYDLELKTHTAKGKLIDVRTTATVIMVDGRSVKLTGIFQNITKQKQIESALIAAKEKAESASSLKNNFLANMSHEIRTPMNSIIGFSDLLKKDDLALETKHKYLNIIDGNSKQLVNLVDDIIDVSKIESNNLKIITENFKISETLIDLEVMFNQLKLDENKSSIIFKAHVPEDCKHLTIKSDGLRIRQLLANLLSNALKFSVQGTISFGFKKAESDLIFYVKDQGIGISPDNITGIFERFKQVNTGVSKNKGTGLGLSICKGIVHLLGGEISVQSTLNVGSVFTFNIPFEEVYPLKSKNIEHKNEIQSFKGITVLLADDDSFIQLYFKEIMKLWEVNILVADNGEIAVEMYKNFPGIALVLMDLRMPIMDGFKATAEILKFDPKAKILAQTADLTGIEKVKIMKIGCKEYLTKPIQKEQLLTVFQKWV
jgi:PAS domain S-box-containing protein